MGLKLYSALGSPAVRGTLLTIRALGLKDAVEIIPINLFSFENMTPEFINKNPCHTVPVLEDGNFTLWDSHAINAYLVTKYGKNDSLYPKDPQKRALVDSMNHFDTGFLFGRSVQIVKAIFTQDKTADLEKIKESVLEVLDMLELILQKRTFAAGNELTIADFSIVATLSTIEIFEPIQKEKYPKISTWYQKMKQLPYYAINEKGVATFKGVINQFSSKL